MPARILSAAVLALALSAPAEAAEAAAAAWWFWPIALFCVSFVLGIVAVLAGVGGGVLFVPMISGFFPFHLDFVRGTGLLLALSGAMAAAPALLRDGMANLRLAMPFALVGSITSIAGALIGLALPAATVQTALGATILVIAALMWRSKRSLYPQVARSDAWATALGLRAVFRDDQTGHAGEWRVHRTAPGMATFAVIGLLAGMFGLGAGWANVPALNLMLGVPLKVSVATSGLMLSIVDTSAAWVYIHRGAVLPMLTVPSIVGVMLGARIGARILRVARAEVIRLVVIALLISAGLRALLKGTGLWN
jgi:uncharacterized membrane protein YfcA